ncbi:MAG: hypothetical protein IBX55_09635 [Methyloprofundus sp.]|nr:hypothetical protein [Methyloprofundus sp.]
MGKQDVISKSILKRIFVDVATYLFGLKLHDVQLIDTEQQRIEDRRADLVAKVQDEAGNKFILHIEIQNQNQRIMPIRMLRYLTDIQLNHPDEKVFQYLLYIGQEKLTMGSGIQSQQLDYQYAVIDMHTIDYHDFITQSTPDAIVMAILCDFKGVPEKQIVHELLNKLLHLTQRSSSEQREYISMLEILANNRSLDIDIQQEFEMLNLEIEQLPSYRIGMKRGESEGELRGEKRGEKIKAILIAKKLLGTGMSIEQIAEITELPLNELEALIH